jgi:hypothetical protein
LIHTTVTPSAGRAREVDELVVLEATVVVEPGTVVVVVAGAVVVDVVVVEVGV